MQKTPKSLSIYSVVLQILYLSFLKGNYLMKLQGLYTFDAQSPSIQVDTFCIHGGPDGYITGIRGNVQCLSDEDRERDETALEKQEMIREKCYLRFPTLPFIPKEPYDVIATDYDNFALVSGSKDKSFVQVNVAFKSIAPPLCIVAN